MAGQAEAAGQASEAARGEATAALEALERRVAQNLQEALEKMLAPDCHYTVTINSLLEKIRPDLMHLPTTNGDHCSGDGIKLAMTMGAGTCDMEAVQVHPTGLVDPEEPDAKVRFLAAEALRGVGGLLFDSNGYRFANELGRRDYVTGEMWKNKAPFRLCLNKAATEEILWHCKHYTGRGVNE